MKILLFHGYMLRGTGSNIYTANLARALADLGHEVHLVCQERGARIEGVEIHNPDIHGLLPVYVKDPYEGFEVKTFSELSEEELSRYVEANVDAIRTIAAGAGGIDLALAGHLVMGPAILARAAVCPFAIKVHGSDLEYTVKPDPRFVPHAEEGAAAANCLLVGSRHTAESLWTALPGLPSLPQKTRLGPPGVDTKAFRPSSSPTDAPAAGGVGHGVPSRVSEGSPCPATGPAAQSSIVSNPSRIVYVGKLIVSKGVDLLLAAWPLVRRKHPDARLQIAGYGEYEQALRRLLAALDRGDLDDAREVARQGWALEGGEERPLPFLAEFLADPPPGYLDAARGIASSVEWLGRLEHDEVAELLPGAEALVMPSTFPEAFGMVAAEAAACGVLPVSAGHSGMREVSAELAAALPAGVAELTSFPAERGAVEAIADRLDAWLALPGHEREGAREALVATVRRLWSWEGVARRVLDAARGDLDRLPDA